MKTVYFVRHGQSEGNVGPIRQAGTAALTEKGRGQAKIIAERISKLDAEILISSPMARAKETAEIIHQKTSLPIEYSDLFVERRRPSEQLGVAKDDPAALESERTIIKNFSIPDFRFSNEENFGDLKERARQMLDYLQGRPEEKIVVVTHGFIMRIVVAYVVFGGSLTARECERFIQKFHMENTALTVFGYGNKDKEALQDWWLWIWNDHAHLG